jgi:hypothetical protein
MRAAALLVVGLLTLAAAGCGSSGNRSLTAVESAFQRAGLPFQSEWRPNRYLARPASEEFAPVRLRPHVVGVAFGEDSARFASWEAVVFDGAGAASDFETLERNAKRVGLEIVLRSRNVVYQGENARAARAAMASLR